MGETGRAKATGGAAAIERLLTAGAVAEVDTGAGAINGTSILRVVRVRGYLRPARVQLPIARNPGELLGQVQSAPAP